MEPLNNGHGPGAVFGVKGRARTALRSWEDRMDSLGQSRPRPGVPVKDPREVSATEADWMRERFSWKEWQPSRRLLRSIRRDQHWQCRWEIVGRLLSKLCVVRYRFWGVVTGADIPLDTRSGGGGLHPAGVLH